MYPGNWTLWTRGIFALGAIIIFLSCPLIAISQHYPHLRHYFYNRHHPHHRYSGLNKFSTLSTSSKNSYDSRQHRLNNITINNVSFNNKKLENWRNNKSKIDMSNEEDEKRFKRYSKYVGYTSSRTTVKHPTKAYVHIQPAISTPTKRKCVRCMVVFKPCPPPPKIVLPVNRYQEPAKNWRGLMYGECDLFRVGLKIYLTVE